MNETEEFKQLRAVARALEETVVNLQVRMDGGLDYQESKILLAAGCRDALALLEGDR